MQNPVRVLDEFQQRYRSTAFVFGVIKKFGDDAAGSLAALIAYYGFVAVFPLLLVFVTVLGLFAGSSSFAHSLENSALAQFPVIGNQLKANVHALHAGSAVGLTVGILVALYGSLGVSQAGQRAMAEVWNIPGVRRPGFFPRLIRSLAFLLVLVIAVLVTTGISSLSTFGVHLALFHNFGFKVGIQVVVVLANVGVYWLAFRILTPASVGTRELLVGAVIGGVGWTILQGAGVYLVGHNLRHASEVYGSFATVLGLLAWLYLASELSVYAAEVNVVLKNRLWPRSIVQPPLTEADREVLDRIALVGERRPEQQVESRFEQKNDQLQSGRAPGEPDAKHPTGS